MKITEIISGFKILVAELETINAAEMPVPPVIPPAIPPVAEPPVIPPVQEPPVVVPPVEPETVPAPTTYKLVPKNMKDPVDGWYESKNLHKDRVAYVQARLTKAAQPGETSRLTYWQITNVVYDGTKNIKDERDFNTATENYANDYTGQTVGSKQHKFTVENGDGKVVFEKNNPKAWNVCFYDMPHKIDEVQRITKEVRYSSAKGKPDGRAKITVDGKVVLDKGGLICNGPRRDFGPQMVYAPNKGDSGDFPEGAYFKVKIIDLEVLR